jgi:hypothetical protein
MFVLVPVNAVLSVAVTV